MFAEDLTAYFDLQGFAESVTVQGVVVAAIYSAASDVLLGEVLTQAPTVELPASVVAAEGGACTVRGVAYIIRQVVAMPPDGAIAQLVLARV